MRHKINSLSLLLLFLCAFTSFVWAGPEAEYKKLSKSWTLNPDGSQVFHCNMELTIYTHTAMRSAYGETFIIYNPDYQTLKINESYTKQKDGTIIRTPDNAFVEVLPYSASDAPAYNNLKEMVVVHTGLELGATIYLDYTLTSKAGYLPAIDILEVIPQSSPVKEYNLAITVPEGEDLSYGLIHPDAEAKVTIENGMRTTSWTLKNVKASSRAPMRHIYDGDIQILTASSYPSEAEALKSLYEQLEMRESMPLLSLAETITEGKDSDTDKLRAILAFVNQNFAHSALSLEETGYRIRPVEEVINSAYGTQAELTDLLQGLLNALRIPTEVCVRFPLNDAPEDSFGLKGASLFLKSEADGATYLLNPFSDKMDNAGWLAGRCRMVDIKSGNPVTLPQPDSKITGEVTMRIDASKVIAEIHAEVPAGLVSYVDVPEKSSTETEELTLANGYALVHLPVVPASQNTQSYASMNTTRKSNLSLLYVPDESYTYTLEIPEGMTLCTLTGKKQMANKAGEMYIEVELTGNKVIVKRSLQVKSTQITESVYPDFHKLMAEWVNPNNTSLILKSIGN